MKDIILIHGALGAGDQLLPLESVLKEHGFKTHVFTLPGHGTQLLSTYHFSIPSFAQALLDFIYEQKLIQPYIFGYSMGGYVALMAASQKPNAIGAIATLGTKFDWTVESAAQEIKKLNAEKIIEKVPRFAEALATRHGESNWKTVLKNTADLMQSLGEKPLISKAFCKSISLPVLTMVAEYDDMVNVNFSEDLTDAFPKGKFKVLQQSYHPIEKVSIPTLSKHLIDFFTYL